MEQVILGFANLGITIMMVGAVIAIILTISSF